MLDNALVSYLPTTLTGRKGSNRPCVVALNGGSYFEQAAILPQYVKQTFGSEMQLMSHDDRPLFMIRLGYLGGAADTSFVSIRHI